MKANQWPTQAEAKKFYGNPQGNGGVASPKWENDNLVIVKAPWTFYAAWSPQTKLKGLRVHKRCADSLKRILDSIWVRVGNNLQERQAAIEFWGMHLCGGAYNFRIMRGGNALSMHSYGCAVDFDPERNGFGDPTPYLAKAVVVLDAFQQEGWTWGGAWRKPDGMHFQACSVN